MAREAGTQAARRRSLSPPGHWPDGDKSHFTQPPSLPARQTHIPSMEISPSDIPPSPTLDAVDMPPLADIFCTLYQQNVANTCKLRQILVSSLIIGFLSSCHICRLRVSVSPSCCFALILMLKSKHFDRGSVPGGEEMSAARPVTTGQWSVGGQPTRVAVAPTRMIFDMRSAGV